jgi:division protein CdvB (Snf7/Vps24/ESCRT-III family)
MKKLTIILLMFMPTVTLAQNYPGMNEADMQNMMRQMEKMQSCMEKVDQSKIEALGERSKKVEAEIKSLCASGKRNQAQDKALAFGKEVANDPSMKAMMKCTENMKGMMPEISFKGLEEESAGRHICD